MQEKGMVSAFRDNLWQKNAVEKGNQREHDTVSEELN
jgi:hypothetical protein